MITFTELLKNRGFDFSKNTLLIRHKDKTISIPELIEKGYLETYQSFQSKKSFENCKYMIVFIGLEQTKAYFYNIYEITGTKDIDKVKMPDGFPYPKSYYKEANSTYYLLNKLDQFDDLRERIIIDWGKGTLAWVQNYTDKEIVQILPKGYLKDFPDYLDFTLSFSDIKKIYDFPDANGKWIDKLSSVNGIYLILDKKTGSQYVGSAYGKDGIWGRWKTYANNGHGNNKLLVELCEKDNNYKLNFQWTILETLPSNLSKDEVIGYETKYKNKLGSRLFGLNIN